MRLRRAGVAVGVGIMVALSGCASEPVTGLVVSKKFEEETSEQRCTKKNGKKRCRTVRDAADYEVRLRLPSGDEKDVSVNKMEYDSLEVGDTFTG